MDVNECIVTILKQLGVGHVFGGSGQVNGSMLIALRKNAAAIKTIIIRHEQAASFMACGYSLFNSHLGVCFATGGPGAFNLFSGLAVAYSDSLPVLAITGYTSSSQRGKGALNESTGRNRTPDSHAMFSATTKKSFIIERPEETCQLMEEALQIAFEGRPRPVHVHVPKDLTVATVPNVREIALDIWPVRPAEQQRDGNRGCMCHETHLHLVQPFDPLPETAPPPMKQAAKMLKEKEGILMLLIFKVDDAQNGIDEMRQQGFQILRIWDENQDYASLGMGNLVEFLVDPHNTFGVPMCFSTWDKV